MMKLAIMQPYFFPYIGYFSLIKHTDKFILLDDVQYIRHGWIERNRVLKQNGGWLFIQVPIIKNEGRDTLIKNILINNSKLWKDKIFAQLEHYKKVAPNYSLVIRMLKEVFENDFIDLVNLNKVSLSTVCKYLGLNPDIQVFSQMGLKIDEPKEPDEWALNICNKLENVTDYINPSGGITFFQKHKFENAGISLKFQKFTVLEYSQKREPFEPGLSIIDVMMFNSVQDINKMLDNHVLI